MHRDRLAGTLHADLASRMRRRVVGAGAAVIVGAFALPMQASGNGRVVPVSVAGGEPWPAKSVRIVVPQAAGGTADFVARMLADRLEPVLGVPVLIDNRPGANGVIGHDAVRRAAPDGYTLLLASTATFVIAPNVTQGEGVDPVRDFAPVMNVARQTKVALVSTRLPVATMRELVAYARQRPGKLNYASTGVGSTSHLDAEMLVEATGMNLVHVPYRGSGQTIAALSIDEVQVLLASVTAALGAIRSDQVRALAIFADRRSPLLPLVPTIAEAGWPGLDVQTWLGVVAPAGTPRAIVGELNRVLAGIVASQSMRAAFDAQGLEPLGGSPASFDDQIRGDVAKWGEVTRRLGVATR